MPVLSIEDLGNVGIIYDQQPFNLPPNAFTGGQNIRFRDGSVAKFKGHSKFLDTGADWDGGGARNAYWLLPIAKGSVYYWIYCGLNDVKVYDGSTATEITNTGADYNATADLNWTGGIIGGIPFLNNGVDDPQEWATVDPGTLLTDLSNWPASTTCRAMRVYKNYLIAMDVTKSGTRYQAMVKWSDGAQIGSVPGSWDETDVTVDANEVILTEARTDTNQGVILDCLPLRDSNIVYKDDSTYSMDFVGGSFVFQFRKILRSQGALSRRCMAEFEGKHFVVGQNDVYVHNGVTSESVIDSKMKRFLYSDMDPTNFQRTFVFPNRPETEMWICYPDDGSPGGLPRKAMVWNWRYNTWGVRDLPDSTAHIEGGIVSSDPITTISGITTHASAPTLTFGSVNYTDGDTVVLTGTDSTPPIDGSYTITKSDSTSGTVPATTTGDGSAGTMRVVSADNWTTDDGTWENWAVTWGTLGFNPQEQSPLMASDNLYKGDDTEQFNGSSFNSRAERLHIPIGEQNEMVRINRVYPRFTGSGSVNISVGVHKYPGGGVNYSSATSFKINTDNKVDARMTGTHLALKVESNADSTWSLDGIDVEFIPVSQRASA